MSRTNQQTASNDVVPPSAASIRRGRHRTVSKPATIPAATEAISKAETQISDADLLSIDSAASSKRQKLGGMSDNRADSAEEHPSQIQAAAPSATPLVPATPQTPITQVTSRAETRAILPDTISSLDDLDLLLDTPVANSAQQPGSTSSSSAKRITKLKLSRSVSTPIANVSAAAHHKNSLSESTRAADHSLSGSLPRSASERSRPAVTTTDDIAASPPTATTPLSRSTLSPTRTEATLRLRPSPPKLLQEIRNARMASRKISFGRTFGADRTMIAVKPSRSSAEAALASVFDDQGEDNPAAGPIDEGLSSSDDEGHRIRSVHELREAGEAQRFKDEMQYFKESLDPSQSLHTRQASCIHFCRKIMSESFSSSIRAHAYMRDVFLWLTQHDDPIMQFGLACLLMILSRDLRNFEPLLDCEPLPSVLVRPLITDMALNVTSRQPKNKSADFASVSAFQVGIDTLSAISGIRGSFTYKVHSELLNQNALPIIATATLKLISENALESDPVNLVRHLRVLEFATLRSTDTSVAMLDVRDLVNSMLVLIKSIQGHLNSKMPKISAEIMTLALRVVLNISGTKACIDAVDLPNWSLALLQIICILEVQSLSGSAKENAAIVKQSASESRSKDSSAFQFDTVILCTSLLTNFVGMDPARAKMLSEMLRHLDVSKQSSIRQTHGRLIDSITTLLHDFQEFHDRVASEHALTTGIDQDHNHSIKITQNSIANLVIFMDSWK
eukprot:jgi/Hompol1/7044/HPOL_001914-RA